MAYDVTAVRERFPALSGEDAPAYLDSACVTLQPEAVVEAVAAQAREHPACGGRSVHRWGVMVSRQTAAARRALGEAMGTPEGAEGIVLVHNTTAAIATVARGIDWVEGDIVLTSDKEHNSNLVPWMQLAEMGVVDHRVVATRPDGTHDLTAWAEAMRGAGGRLRLVATHSISNVDGAAVDVAEVARLAREHGARVLIDAAQSLGHGLLDVAGWGVDYVAAALHKAFGPGGMGVLAGTVEALDALRPSGAGGGSVRDVGEDGCVWASGASRLEGGLGNYGGIAGVVPALAFVEEVRASGLADHLERLVALADESLAGVPELRRLGPAAPTGCHGIVAFAVDGHDPHDVAVLLDEHAGVLVRSGMHCVHRWHHRRGLEAGSLRASLHATTSEDDVRRFCSGLREILDVLGGRRA